jgi:Holliday junction resolvase RusA-like endonuclease
VSLQAQQKKKQKLKNAIHQVIKGAKYYLTGEVQIEIEWLVHERERYETDSSPDIDNVVKPLLDALSGPHGILIDDCQAQAVSCHWIDWTRNDHQINFRIKYFPDEWTLKDSLVFVDFGNNLCFPVHSNWTKKVSMIMLDAVEEMLILRQKIEQKTEDYYAAKGVMPIQRLFHRSRLEGQHIVKKDDYRSSLDGK